LLIRLRLPWSLPFYWPRSFPARGGFVPFFEGLTTAAIALLFFMHGAKLSREAIIAGGSHWRLHLWVMCSTFILFPILGVLFAWWAPVNVDPALYTGFLYLCILPATVQSAIAFTSLAGGNVAAAVCSASASSLLGIFVSPLLVGLLMNMHGAEGNLEQVGKICLQLLLPFVLGISRVRGRAHLWRSTRNGSQKPTRRRFCWWSIPPSAKRS
jgi:sodium/bile acid cotransporter 7